SHLFSLLRLSSPCSAAHRDLHSFPTRRSSDLFEMATVMRRPSRSRPFSWPIAFCASSAVFISTKPKPRDWPEKRSVMTVADCTRSEEHTSELQSRGHLVCRLLLEKKNQTSRVE